MFGVFSFAVAAVCFALAGCLPLAYLAAAGTVYAAVASSNDDLDD